MSALVLFVSLDSRVKKVRVPDAATPQAVHAAAVAAFADDSSAASTRLYVPDAARGGVYFELDDVSDLFDGAQCQLRRAVQQGVAPRAPAPLQQGVAPQPVVPVFLPNGRVRVNGQEFVVPRGGTGGTGRPEQGPNWFVRLLLGRPFNAVSPRSGLKRPASRWQTFAKIVYGNPLVPAKMGVADEKRHLQGGV
jgi:hypothetical protein